MPEALWYGGSASLSLYILLVGLPHRRASQVYTIWLSAQIGFQVAHITVIIGPPAWSGFPYT